MVKEIREKLERAIKDAYLNRDAVNILVGAMDEAIGELKEYEDRPRKLCEDGFHLYYELYDPEWGAQCAGSLIYKSKKQAEHMLRILADSAIHIREVWMKPYEDGETR